MFFRFLLLFFINICFYSKIFSVDPIIISEKINKKISRTFQNMSYSPKGDPIFFCLSLPEKIPNEGLTCIIVMAGLATGQKNLEYIEDPKNFVFIGYEYPSILRKKNKSIFDFYMIRKKTLHIPLDILDIIQWIKKQSWSNKKVSIAGFSFGAMFVPNIYHETQKEDIALGPGIIAFAGADIYPLLKINLPGNKLTKSINACIASYLLESIEPSKHLPYLKNDFLIINGKYDDYIPFDQAKKLQDLTPYPKTIINLETSHLSPTNKKQLKTINHICDKWFDEKLNH